MEEEKYLIRRKENRLGNLNPDLVGQEPYECRPRSFDKLRDVPVHVPIQKTGFEVLLVTRMSFVTLLVKRTKYEIILNNRNGSFSDRAGHTEKKFRLCWSHE